MSEAQLTNEQIEARKKQFDDYLVKLSECMKWGVENDLDPWLMRQAMITIMDIDTYTMLDKGINALEIARFDGTAHTEAKIYYMSMIQREAQEKKSMPGVG